MIKDNTPQDESQEPKAEDQPICQNCQHWALMGANPQNQLAFGACANRDFEMAPFGVMTANFGGCDGFEKKETPKKILVPTSKLNRISGI